MSAGAGTAAGQGVSYTLDSIVYKTFTTPVEDLEVATILALERMDIEIMSREEVESGTTLTAQAGDREIEIELDRLTPRASRMRVNAKLNWFFKDRATAVEIITQTSQIVDEQTRQAQQPKPAAPARPVSARPAKPQAPAK